MKKATQLQNSVDFFEIKDYFKKIGTNLQLRDKSVSVSFCPPTEFTLARNLILDSAHSSITTARKRAIDFSNDVSYCGPLGWLSELIKWSNEIKFSLKDLEKTVNI